MSADAPGAREPMIVIGRLGVSHGVRGEIRLFAESDVEGRFESLGQVWWLGRKGQCQPLEVVSLRRAGAFFLVRFRGIETPEAAARFSHGALALPASQRGPAPEGSYFIDDILGLTVADEAGRLLGRVTNVYRTGANDVYEIRGAAEILLPALESVILEVDLQARRMRVRVPAGLLE